MDSTLEKEMGARMNQNETRKNYFAVGVFLLAAVLVCLLSIACKSYINFDESFTINLVSHSLPDMIRLTSLDVHPPLYYFVVKLFTLVLGQNPVAYYAPSILCFMSLLILSGLFFKKYFSEKTALFVVVVLCSAPQMLKYALQIRMYSMAMLLITVSFYIVYVMMQHIIEKKDYKWNKYWVALAIVNVLAAYTHYFAGLAAVAISLFLLGYLLYAGSERGRTVINWCIYCAVMIILYLPWLPILFRQLTEVHSDYWIGRVTENVLHSYPDMVVKMPTEEMRLVLIAIYVTGFALFLFHWKKEHQNCWLAGCYIVTGIWFVMGVGYSVIRTPIMHDRYLIPLLPLLWIPICVTCARNAHKYLQMGVLFAFVICFAQNYQDVYNRYNSHYQNDMVARLSYSMGEEDVFFHAYVQDMAIGKAYFPDTEQYMFEGIDKAEVFHSWPELTRCQLIKDAEELNDVQGNIWCMNGEMLGIFEELGWKVETIEFSSGNLYRIHR